MATPRSDVYTAASGASVCAGYPSWYKGPGKASRIPNTTLLGNPAGWTGADPGGNGSFIELMHAFSGGAVTEAGVWYQGAFRPGTWMVFGGGGHDNRGGNERMAAGPCEAESPSMVRLTDPTIPAPINVLRDVNGAIVASHEYDMVQVDADSNRFIRFGVGARYNSGNPGETIDAIDLNTMATTPGPDMPTFGSNGAYDAMSGYNETTRKYWLLTKDYIYSIDRATLVSTRYTGRDLADAGRYPSNSKGCVDPIHNVFVVIDNRGVLMGRDLNSPAGSAFVPLAVTGTGPASSASAGTQGAWVLDWDRINQRIVAWHHEDSNRVFYLRTAPIGGTWAWSNFLATGDAVPIDTDNGAYGRVRAVGLFGGGLLLLPNYWSDAYFIGNLQ